jgi:tyrosyl-tRNA synthetase
MNALDFLRDVGKTVTVAYMMSKESVQRRIETGISFTEFSYQLLQGYDFQVLYDQFQCKVQMGGSDQWGNITTGTEFVSRNLNGKAYAITTPLLTKADGTKFGKSEQGNIWLDPALTSPYQFYQFWINCDDRDLPKFMRYFTLRSREEVEALEQEHAKDPRTLKRLLAEELTARVHSQEALESAQQVSAIVFDPKSGRESLLAMDAGTLTAIGQEIPYFQVPAALLQEGVSVVELLTRHAAIFKSNNEVRQAIKGNALQLNKVRIETHEHIVGSDTWLHQRFVLVENGKKSKYLLEVVS